MTATKCNTPNTTVFCYHLNDVVIYIYMCAISGTCFGVLWIQVKVRSNCVLQLPVAFVISVCDFVGSSQLVPSVWLPMDIEMSC